MSADGSHYNQRSRSERARVGNPRRLRTAVFEVREHELHRLREAVMRFIGAWDLMPDLTCICTDNCWGRCVIDQMPVDELLCAVGDDLHERSGCSHENDEELAQRRTAAKRAIAANRPLTAKFLERLTQLEPTYAGIVVADMRWADVGPLWWEAREAVAHGAEVLCPEWWHEHTPLPADLAVLADIAATRLERVAPSSVFTSPDDMSRGRSGKDGPMAVSEMVAYAALALLLRNVVHGSLSVDLYRPFAAVLPLHELIVEVSHAPARAADRDRLPGDHRAR